MPLRIGIKELRRRLAELHLANDGDGAETVYWPAIMNFPNYERFWRDLVVPLTKRIELPMDSPLRHERRDGIGQAVWDISYANYSLFLNLAYAADHLRLPLSSSFGNFYGHLGSALDLAEDFLLAIHVLVSKCRGRRPSYPPELSRETFLEIAGKWYDKDYSKLYEHYQKKGKMRPLYLPSRQMVLDDYFGAEHGGWKRFKTLSEEIRPYRNKVVHDVAMGAVIVGDGKYHLVPRRERACDYGKMHAIGEAANDPARLKQDFVVRQEQMGTDMRSLQGALDDIWQKPIADLCRLLYDERNPILLQEYDIELVDG